MATRLDTVLTDSGAGTARERLLAGGRREGGGDGDRHRRAGFVKGVWVREETPFLGLQCGLWIWFEIVVMIAEVFLDFRRGL